jgi:hypothetical protein
LTNSIHTTRIISNNWDAVGGTLVSLELERPYPENYQAHVAQVVRENESDYLPPLRTSIENIESYDTVFTGFSVIKIFPSLQLRVPGEVRAPVRSS